MMLRCKDATRMASQSLDGKLPLYRRFQLRVHLAMCRLCWGFRRDAVKLHEEVRNHAEQLEQGVVGRDQHLSAEARQRIKKTLDA